MADGTGSKPLGNFAAYNANSLLIGWNDRVMADVQQCGNIAKRIDSASVEDAPHFLPSSPHCECIDNPVSLTLRPFHPANCRSRFYHLTLNFVSSPSVFGMELQPP
ncbi:hypothetical protein TcWFU_009494 [Taenia crassiceps]|uniref:Uncharacterized protein n=1 Tax=Taenia crassiceps TaxID=6207 RepID=A0ABR4QT87_9CEST